MVQFRFHLPSAALYREPQVKTFITPSGSYKRGLWQSGGGYYYGKVLSDGVGLRLIRKEEFELALAEKEPVVSEAEYQAPTLVPFPF